MENTREMIEQPEYLELLFDSIITDLIALKTSLDTTNTLATENKTRTNSIYAILSGTYCKTNPGLAIGTTVTLGTDAFQCAIKGASYYKSAANTAFTATTHDVATGSKWACYRVSINSSLTITITISASNDYATEALAIAAVPAVPSDECDLGYITIQSTAGAIWNATTDALAGGTGGTPAAATNYYSAEIYDGYAAVSSSDPTAVGTLITTT